MLFFFLLYLLPVCENCYVAANGMGRLCCVGDFVADIIDVCLS